jgi:hypothetical protein
MQTYARLYHGGKTYNLGTFDSDLEVKAAKAGAMAMLTRLAPEEKKPVTVSAAKPAEEIFDNLKVAISRGKLDPFLPELLKQISERKAMLDRLPKQSSFKRVPTNRVPLDRMRSF